MIRSEVGDMFQPSLHFYSKSFPEKLYDTAEANHDSDGQEENYCQSFIPFGAGWKPPFCQLENIEVKMYQYSCSKFTLN